MPRIHTADLCLIFGTFSFGQSDLAIYDNTQDIDQVSLFRVCAIHEFQLEVWWVALNVLNVSAYHICEGHA